MLRSHHLFFYLTLHLLCYTHNGDASTQDKSVVVRGLSCISVSHTVLEHLIFCFYWLLLFLNLFGIIFMFSMCNCKIITYLYTCKWKKRNILNFLRMPSLQYQKVHMGFVFYTTRIEPFVLRLLQSSQVWSHAILPLYSYLFI